MQDEERHVMVDNASAVTTVKYDETGTKLFIGGGPRRAGVPGPLRRDLEIRPLRLVIV